MLGRLLLALLACIALVGCDRKDPSSPDTGEPSGDVQVSGGERIGWTQRAADAVELALFQFVIYVDGARGSLTAVTCSSDATAAGFECSAALPPLTPGLHTLELASVVLDPAGVLESARSAPLRVVMTSLTGRGSTFTSVPVRTTEGVTLMLERVADGLRHPSDIAFGPDGAIFVAERGGTVRAIKDGVLGSEPALDVSADVVLPDGGLLAIALDLQFDETSFMYALYAAGAPRGGLEVMLARFRGVNDRFGERAILLARMIAPVSQASGALRLGADGKLYVGVDGEILRLNTDATTPDDHIPFSPVYSPDHPDPKALDWHPLSSDLWVIDGVQPSGGRLSAVPAMAIQQRRAVPRTAYRLPQGTGPASAVFYRGRAIPSFRSDLFVAAEAGRQLIRLRFDPDNATRITLVDRLLKDEIGPVRVVAEGREGALYVASDAALYRLRP